MENPSEELLEKAISDNNINKLEYKQFINGIKIETEGSGTIYKYEWKDCELTIALKRLKVDINLLKLLRNVCHHPNIIPFYGVTKDLNGHYNMVLQFASDGNLRQYLRKKFTSLQWTDKLHISKEILRGLIFLHNNNIVHQGLHSKNILIHQGQIKIADFGLTKPLNDTSMTSYSLSHGMPAYIEPQCLINPQYIHNKKSDIYSFGVILWEISSGKPPFQDIESTLCMHIIQGNREEPVKDTPSQYVELYKQCWDNDPALRPETKLIFETLNQIISNIESIKIDHLAENCTAGESIKIDHLAENCTADETSSSKFESRIYPWGVSENIKTPALTIKSIRKLRNNEHKMVNYEQNSPYEVEVEEEIVYENGVSHLIWFFANADYVKNRPPVYNKSAPILYYFLSNLEKKVEIPLLNKCSINEHTTYSIKGTEDILQIIKEGKSDPDLISKAQKIENE